MFTRIALATLAILTTMSFASDAEREGFEGLAGKYKEKSGGGDGTPEGG